MASVSAQNTQPSVSFGDLGSGFQIWQNSAPITAQFQLPPGRPQSIELSILYAVTLTYTLLERPETPPSHILPRPVLS